MVHGRYIIDNMSEAMNPRFAQALLNINDRTKFLFVLGNRKLGAAKIELTYFKEFEAKLLKELMTLQTRENEPHLPASIQYEIKIRQKRDSKSLLFQPDLNVIENHVHNKVMKYNPSLLPYAREIQNDLALLLLYMKLKRMATMSSNASNLDGTLTNRDEFTRGFYTFLFFVRDRLASHNPEYPPQVRQIKNDVVGALRRLGKVKKRQNGFK